MIFDDPLCCVTCRVMTRQNKCPICDQDDNLMTIPEIRLSIKKWQRRNGILSALAAERISILERALNEVLALQSGSSDIEELSPALR